MHAFVRCFLAPVALMSCAASAQEAPPPVELPPPEMSSMSGEYLEPWIEYEQRMNQEQRLTAFGPDLLGDSVDPNTGQITFEHTDVVLPGNSKLDVSLRRRVSQGYLYGEGVNAEFGNWQHVVPRIVVITRPTGWTGNRCTQSYATSFPPMAMASTNPVQYLQNWEYSNGVQLEVPGQASQQVLEYAFGAQWPTGGPTPTRYTTAENWRFTCGVTAKNSQNQNSGQGFMGYAPNGTRYRFDRYIKRNFRPLGAMASAKTNGTSRAKSILAATYVEDVNGNWVTYEYDSSDRLQKIESNDGRLIDLVYQGTSKAVYQVIANPASTAPRTWTYSYRNTSGGRPPWESGGAINIKHLDTVNQPDGRSWQLELDGMYVEPTPGECETGAWQLRVTHPYGVMGTFWLVETRHRYGLNDTMQELFDCPSGEPSPPPPPPNPNWVTMLNDTMSVYSKRLEGPGITPATWTFEYELDQGPPGSSGTDPTNWTKVTQPDGSQHTYYHRWQYGSLGGMLFRKEIRNSPTAEPLEILEHRQPAEPTGAPSFVVEAFTGGTFGILGTDVGAVKIRPDIVTIKRGHDSYAGQFDTFTTDNDYDSTFSSSTYSFGNPTLVTETSSTAPGLSRTTVNTYLHYKTAPLWVIGLPDTVTRNGRLFDDYGYDLLGRLQTHSRFGTQLGSYTYHALAGQQGMVATFTDALSNLWTLSNWKRGKPQSVLRPDNTTFTRVVHDNGWVTSETDGRNVTTGFALQRDGLAHLRRSSRPLRGYVDQLHGPWRPAAGCAQPRDPADDCFVRRNASGDAHQVRRHGWFSRGDVRAQHLRHRRPPDIQVVAVVHGLAEAGHRHDL